MRYATSGALRAALDQRLVSQANESGTDITRLRRRVVFERLLVRFALADDSRWVLKGGAAVEIRLGDRARATKDLDLAVSGREPSADQLRELLVEALIADPQGDFFEFRIDRFRQENTDAVLGPVWRASVDCLLDGRTFDRVVVDLVARESEVNRVELLKLPGTLAFAGMPPVEILAVDLRQHFAEKLHALVRTYGDRPSSRVKDLADLVLFIDLGLDPDAELGRAVVETFQSRGDDELPMAIPDPPADWEPRYAVLAEDLQLSASTISAAMTTLRAYWSAALETRQGH